MDARTDHVGERLALLDARDEPFELIEARQLRVEAIERQRLVEPAQVEAAGDVRVVCGESAREARARQSLVASSARCVRGERSCVLGKP